MQKRSSMTEAEYIEVKDLGHIINAINCLSNILPVNSKHVTTEEYKTVMEIISTWKDKHFESIELKIES